MKYKIKKYTKLDGSFEFSVSFISYTYNLLGFKLERINHLDRWGGVTTKEYFTTSREGALNIIDQHYNDFLKSNTKSVEVEYIIK